VRLVWRDQGFSGSRHNGIFSKPFRFGGAGHATCIIWKAAIVKQDTVLFVDDEESLLKSIKRLVADQLFNSLFASSGQKALELLEQHAVQVIVIDMRMPEMSGLELLRTVKIKYPKTIRMVLSGYLPVAMDSNDVFMYIVKPWKTDQELLSAITLGLKHYHFGVLPPEEPK
jgi:two-component system, NtrC family, response regulator HupR/HoxA